MYKILKSTPNGIDELELEQLEKGCWIDIVSPSPEAVSYTHLTLPTIA